MHPRRFIEGECGRSNPLLDLASHVTRDSANRDMTSIQSTSNEMVDEFGQESSSLPQTFRMADIMQQIQNIAVASENSWRDEYRSQFNPSTSWIATTIQEPSRSLNEPVPQVEYQPYFYSSQNIGEYPPLHRFLSPPLMNEAHPVNHFRSMGKYERKQKEIQDSVKKFWNVINEVEEDEVEEDEVEEDEVEEDEVEEDEVDEDDEVEDEVEEDEVEEDEVEEDQVEEDEDEVDEDEVDKDEVDEDEVDEDEVDEDEVDEDEVDEDEVDEDEVEEVQEDEETVEQTEKELIYFDGIYTEDVHKAETPDIVRGRGENFLRFLNNYRKKFQNRDFDILDDKEYTFCKNNPYITKVSNMHTIAKKLYQEKNFAEAVLYFEAAVQVNPDSIHDWRNLVNALTYNGQYYDAYCVAKENLDLDPNYFSMHVFNFLYDEQCYYQACQVILNWLRDHPVYRDAVPPDFEMEDSSSTLVEKAQLAKLQKILMTAAQRRPVNPDSNVQLALSKLLEMSQDFEKSRDCLLTIAKNNRSFQSAWLPVGYNCLRSDDSHKALEVIENEVGLLTSAQNRFKFKGLVSLYFGDYKKAGQYFLSALRRPCQSVSDCEKANTEEVKQLWVELQLCTELLRREDLQTLVKERNFTKLREEFNFEPIFT